MSEETPMLRGENQQAKRNLISVLVGLGILVGATYLGVNHMKYRAEKEEAEMRAIIHSPQHALERSVSDPDPVIADNFDCANELYAPSNKQSRIQKPRTNAPIHAPRTNAPSKNALRYSAGQAPITAPKANDSSKQYSKAPKIRNNNPGNLRAIPGKKWKGQVAVDRRGFCVFNSLEDGIRAMGKNLKGYDTYEKDTITEIIERWAPSVENNTIRYISRVSKDTGYHPEQKLNLNDKTVVTNLIIAMVKQEHGKYVPGDLVSRALSDIYN